MKIKFEPQNLIVLMVCVPRFGASFWVQNNAEAILSLMTEYSSAVSKIVKAERGQIVRAAFDTILAAWNDKGSSANQSVSAAIKRLAALIQLGEFKVGGKMHPIDIKAYVAAGACAARMENGVIINVIGAPMVALNKMDAATNHIARGIIVDRSISDRCGVAISEELPGELFLVGS